MKIILANPRGFCAGVNMAIESLERALRALRHAPVRLPRDRSQPADRRPVPQPRRRVCGRSDEVPDGGTLLYRAHGVSPSSGSTRAERRLRAIDATCPLVTKVHLEAVRFAREGYTILLIGHEGHDEVIGTMGEAPEHILLVEDVADVERLTLPADAKLAYLTQTTLSVDDAKVVIDALRRSYPQIVGPHARTTSVTPRRTARRPSGSSSREADMVLVLGSQNSSNSQRLAELAQAAGKPAYLIDGVEELRDGWFRPADTVLITAGASAPEDHVQECVEYLRERFGAAIESRVVREEHVSFPLPRELRVLAN